MEPYSNDYERERERDYRELLQKEAKKKKEQLTK